MRDPIVVADLLKQEGRRPSIRFEDAKLCSTLHDHEDHPVIGFYKVCNGSVRAGYGSISPEKHCKAMSKGVNAAATLTQILNGKEPVSGHGDGPELCRDRGLPSMIVGDTVVVADETFSKSHGIDAHSRNMFFSIEFHFPTASMDRERSLTSIQHLQISCPNLKFNDSLFTEHGTPVYDHIEIISGVCTFNGELLKASISNSESGGVYPDKIMRTKPTIQEMEYIARSSSAIADMTSMFILRIQEHKSTALVSIGLDVPSFHYYHSVVAKFESGLCTASEALKWMEAVDLRHDQIAEVFMNSVQHELRRRGIKLGSYEIHTSSKTTPAAISIRQALQNRTSPSLESVLQKLGDEKDGLWRNFYQLIPTKEKPQDWADLGYLFYVFEVVKLALIIPGTRYQPTSMLGRTYRTESAFTDQLDPTSAKQTRSKPRQLIISIDDPAERRIYSRSQELLKKIRQSRFQMTNPTLVEVCLCRKIFVNGNKEMGRLYHHDPMPEAPLLSHPSERDSDGGQLVEPLDVVRRLYGSDCAQNLKSLFAQVGL